MTLQSTDTRQSTLRAVLTPAVIVSALGYFVDIYDLILFSIVRIPSLRSLGLSGDELMHVGIDLLNYQMIGMLVGGIFWGILGDKKGRLTILFGSILMYSLANIANGFVQEIWQYEVLRFIAGVGLAGELGAGITLVAETLDKESRGWGTMIIASFGVCGAILAYFMVQLFDWRNAYFIGGGLGLVLLVLRISVFESGMFDKVKASGVKRGHFFGIFTSGALAMRYLKCVLVGLPLWAVVGILVTLSPEFAKNFGLKSPVNAGEAIMLCYVGLAIGDLVSGWLSQVLRSRKEVLLIFLVADALFMAMYFILPRFGFEVMYLLAFMLGLSSGYWAIFVTVAAEQFGTNLRATVATTVPNFVRGALVPMTWAFELMNRSLPLWASGAIVCAVSVTIALVALTRLEETFGRELDYHEEM